jgi:hypothetical protein
MGPGRKSDSAGAAGAAVWLSCFVIGTSLAWLKQRLGWGVLWVTPVLLRLLTTSLYLRHGSLRSSRSVLEAALSASKNALAQDP